MKEERVVEDRVLQALHALAENDREREAPPAVEARILAAFHSRRRSGWRSAAIAATAAVLAIALLLWPSRRPKPAVSAAPLISKMPAVARPAPVVVAPANVTRTPRKLARKMAAAPQPQAREVVTDFFPLMNPAPSFERGQILRVQLPAAAMQTVGLPVREEHLGDLVQADVLVGEEGIPRAIRFVRFDVK